ncbi:kinesin light chain 2 [Fusarium pseudoanthophilum]|uniref:Kinesin light chain 2 n=1 Tax=Fusarium pseudoanthophilum TaxID=48495 RepID=A0A8H5KH18_9HYPO|nr:kinesin light chain 2 [Fusarium pseudoanthophilum]
MDPWFTNLNDLFSELDDFSQQFPTIHLSPSIGIPAPHELALDGYFVSDQNHSYAPLDPFFGPFIYESPDASAINSTDGLGATQLTPAPTMGPPQKSRKRKAPTLRDEDWEPFRDRILELYETQKLPLEKVKSMMEEEFGFTAQLRQYQSRITKWGKDKNIKKAEMKAIVRKHQQREILETGKRKLCFTVRGREVDASKIDRWMVRNNVPRNDLYAPSPAASHSPALSEMSLTFSSSGGMRPVSQNPMASSPALSVRGIIHGHGRTFAGQSPAPFYRALPAQLPASYPSSAGPVHPASGSTLALQQYRYKQADEDHLRSELFVAETWFGSEHIETIHILTMLAEVLLRQGRFKSAEEVIRRTVTGYQKTVGGDDIRTLDALELLGQVLNCQGLYCRASRVLEELLDTKRVSLGGEHHSTLSCMVALSNVYQNQYLWDKAALLSEQVLEITRRIWGEADHGTLTTMSDLGAAYMHLGRLEESSRLIGHAFKLSMALLGNEHVTTLNIMYHLLALYTRQNDWVQAEVIAKQVTDTCMKTLGEEHPSTLFAKAELAMIYEGLGQLEKAEKTGEEVLEMQKRVLGENHPDTLQTAHTLIIAYTNQKEYGKVEELGRYIEEMEWAGRTAIQSG